MVSIVTAFHDNTPAKFSVISDSRLTGGIHYFITVLCRQHTSVDKTPAKFSLISDSRLSGGNDCNTVLSTTVTSAKVCLISDSRLSGGTAHMQNAAY